MAKSGQRRITKEEKLAVVHRQRTVVHRQRLTPDYRSQCRKSLDQNQLLVQENLVEGA